MMQSVLEPPRTSLALYTVLALFGHVMVVATLLGFSALHARNRKPLIDLEVMEVTVAMRPQSKTRMPEKASRAPVSSGLAPAPATAPVTAPPPPVESDLVFHKPDAPKPADQAKVETPKQGAPDRSDARSEAIRKLMMQQLVTDASAPEGARDRQATDPDSTTDESIAGVGGRGDPELARYEEKIRALIKPHFKPLPTITAANPSISAVVQLEVDLDSGKILNYWIKTSSGNASYDAAAERAVAAVGQIPPPPEKYRARYTAGYGIKLVPP